MIKKKQPPFPLSPTPHKEAGIRINKYLSNAGICSRRKAEALVLSGAVYVNEQKVSQLSLRIHPADVVRVHGKAITPEKKVYLLLNKPKNYLTTTSDPRDRKTVMDLTKNACKETLYPVGRLDRKTMGLLVLTNDGTLAKKLSHPSGKIKKIYDVTLSKPLQQAQVQAILDGLELEDGKARVDELVLLDTTRKHVGIEIHMGKNRIIRRIFEHLGNEVIRLDRVRYGHLTKKNLTRGQWRFLTPSEVRALYKE